MFVFWGGLGRPVLGVGGPSCSSPVNQTYRGSAGNYSSVAGTWLPCEEGAEE